MKKCPECGNASYDGALVCGNCGYKFSKHKVTQPKKTNIFQEEPKEKSIKKSSNQQSTLEIIKEKKLIIGAIIIITAIIICGIVISGNYNPTLSTNTNTNDNTVKVSEAGFTFSHPTSWSKINGEDSDHTNALYFNTGNNTIVEYYNVSSSYTSLKEITQERISYAQENGDYIDSVQTITLDHRNASDIVLEDSNGNYIRFVSLFSDGKLYVYKITGDSANNVNSQAVNSVLNTSHIE